MTGLPFRVIAVSGSSMSPTYNNGDWLLFRKRRPPVARNLQHLVGKVVVVERESYPGVCFIKRIIRADINGIWVEGDNKEASTDSRQWGELAPSEIVGIVFFRYRRGEHEVIHNP